jgi:MFS transporter, DHA3 family, macrolide efflux protein
MKELKTLITELRGFLILWLTQSFSALGSSMTNFALIVWSYQQHGSALITALLSICSYAPYVIMSIFAGALSDRWDKKTTMLISDSFAALCSVAVLVLLQSGRLEIWHLYCLNALNGLMNTVQQPAADVTISLLTPKKHYQKVSGMHSFSNSLVSIVTPVIATALLALTNMQVVIAFDLFSFGVAFFALLFFVKIPKVLMEDDTRNKKESVIQSAKSGLEYLKHNRGILNLILFLAAINFTASVYNAALPAMLLSRAGGGKLALGAVNTVTGITMLLGSVIVSVLPAPKSRVRTIFNALLLSMSTENFLLAFGKEIPVWCIGAFLGWIAIPIMSANMDVLFRNRIPIEMQGRVFSTRNTLQFFTIPLGYFVGGILVDQVFEPFMASLDAGKWLGTIFGYGKGSGAALLFFILGCIGVITCLIFRRNKHIWELEIIN